MTTPLTLYTHPWSRGRVARWMLEETGLPYQTEILDYGTTMKAPAYRAINPMGKVPAIQHGDTVVTENAAILLYLADLVPEKKLAPPVGTPARGPYYRWIAFMAPLEAMLTAKSAGALAKPEQAGYGSEADVLATLEGALKGRDHLAGDHFTAADLFVAASIGFYLQFKMLEPRPDFVRFAELHAQRPAALRQPAHDDPVASDNLLAVNAQILPRFMWPFGHHQPPGDRRPGVLRPAVLDWQSRQIHVRPFNHALLTGWPADLLRGHIQHLLKDR